MCVRKWCTRRSRSITLWSLHWEIKTSIAIAILKERWECDSDVSLPFLFGLWVLRTVFWTNVWMSFSPMKTWCSGWSLWSWSWRDRRMFWSFVTRLSCDVFLRISWTRLQVWRSYSRKRETFKSESTSLRWSSSSVSVTTDELPYLKCPLHTVLKLTPIAYGELCTFFFKGHIRILTVYLILEIVSILYLQMYVCMYIFSYNTFVVWNKKGSMNLFVFRFLFAILSKLVPCS